MLHFRSGGWKFECIEAVFMFENSSNGILSKYTNWCHLLSFTLLKVFFFLVLLFYKRLGSYLLIYWYFCLWIQLGFYHLNVWNIFLTSLFFLKYDSKFCCTDIFHDLIWMFFLKQDKGLRSWQKSKNEREKRNYLGSCLLVSWFASGSFFLFPHDLFK